MAVTDRDIRDALAAQDAAVLRRAVEHTLGLPALPVAARRPAAALLDRLRDAADERALDHALTVLPALTSSVGGWPTPAEARAALALVPPAHLARRSWQDRRIVRFAAVVSVLHALEEGPGSPRGRELAATALALSAGAGAAPARGMGRSVLGASAWSTSGPARRPPLRRTSATRARRP
ncbi:MAG: hypothetical protein AB7V58_04080 [Solirubrobacterales bacterium]